MNSIERKIVLNYLRNINYKDGLFVIINSIKARHESQEQYDNMPIEEKELMLKKIVVNYLVDSISQSLIGYTVHGTPNKRILKLYKLMRNKYDDLSDEERAIIYQKILKN
jgi:hypothetical protein